MVGSSAAREPRGTAGRRYSAEIVGDAPCAGQTSAFGATLPDASPLPEPQHQLLGHPSADAGRRRRPGPEAMLR